MRILLARSIDRGRPAPPDLLEDVVIADAPFGTANINFLKHFIPVRCILAIVLESLLKNTT